MGVVCVHACVNSVYMCLCAKVLRLGIDGASNWGQSIPTSLYLRLQVSGNTKAINRASKAFKGYDHCGGFAAM